MSVPAATVTGMAEEIDRQGLPVGMQRVVAAAVAEERPTLEAFLDFYRDALVRKVRGIAEHDARRRLVGSHTTLAGLLKHLRVVEMNWFQRILAGMQDADLPVPMNWRDPDSSFVLEASDTVESLAAAYRAQCQTSRRIAGDRQLGEAVPHPELGQVRLRWIYIHMIDETARHAGHADILREQTDSHTGP